MVVYTDYIEVILMKYVLIELGERALIRIGLAKDKLFSIWFNKFN